MDMHELIGFANCYLQPIESYFSNESFLIESQLILLYMAYIFSNTISVKTIVTSVSTAQLLASKF